MLSIWIGEHAIDQYAERVQERDHTKLAKGERDWIKAELLRAYQHSYSLTEANRVRLGLTGRRSPNWRFCTFKQEGKRITLILVCVPDNRHASGALKMVTVIKVKETNIKHARRKARKKADW